jgi:hypothetical protein
MQVKITWNKSLRLYKNQSVVKPRICDLSCYLNPIAYILYPIIMLADKPIVCQ